MNHVCPECGAPRGRDNAPLCDCGRRVSDALRDERAAQAAAVEDFDPLRIRPYVEMADGDDAPHLTAPDATMPLGRVTGPSSGDLRLFEPGPPGGADVPAEERRPRRGRLLAVGVVGAVVAVVAAAGMASGLFSYDSPTRDTAGPADIRESVPEPTDDASPEHTSARPSVSASASPSASPSTAGPSASPVKSSTLPSPAFSSSAHASPSPSVPSAPAPRTATATADPDTSPPAFAPSLRRGDSGPEVEELQLRLGQLNLYDGPVDAYFGRQVESAVSTYQWYRGIAADEYGVYGPTTRASLESETREP